MTTNAPPVYNGRYELRNQIARGGTAQVYLARDLVLDRLVALKVLFPELSTDHSFVERFRREAQAAANLSHANIVPVFDWGESDSTYFIVMEYVDGEPLSSIIRTQAPIPAVQAATVGAGIAKALAYAHRHGVVHRDVKPGNVLITADGQVKVADFGIARAIGSDEQVTQTGLVMGTATYFSPEQAQGLPVDARSDVYALGVVLYEMLAGRPPFVGESPVAIAYQHVREEPPPLRSVAPDVPPALEAIVAQAMAKLPAERYASAADLQADLERFVRGQTVLARPPSGASGQTTIVNGLTQSFDATAALPGTGYGAAEPPPPPRRRTTTWRWSLAAVVLLAAIGVSVFYGGRQLGYFGGAKYFDEPSVLNTSISSAEHTLTAKGLKPVERLVSYTRGAPGKVVEQQPGAHTSVRSGDVVDLYVPRQSPAKDVPSVVGEQYSVAAPKLVALGMKVVQQPVPQTHTNQVQGTVSQQSASGMQIPGTTITLSVISGSHQFPVPDVSGQTQEAATRALENAGFVVNPNPTTALSATVPQGEVISTSPPANTPTFKGTTVTLQVSEGGVTVPLVLGDDLATAEAALANARLVPGLLHVIAPTVPGCASTPTTQLVCGTIPANGVLVQPGKKVGILVGRVLATSTVPAPTTTTPAPTTTTPAPTTTTPSGSSGSSGTTATAPASPTGSTGAPTGSTGAPSGSSGATPGSQGNGNGRGNGNQVSVAAGPPLPRLTARRGPGRGPGSSPGAGAPRP